VTDSRLLPDAIAAALGLVVQGRAPLCTLAGPGGRHMLTLDTSRRCSVPPRCLASWRKWARDSMLVTKQGGAEGTGRSDGG